MKDIRNQPIGVFDSGVGGLTVIQEILQQMPQESFIYFADTAHVPYGPREPEELRSLASAITAFLVEAGCKSIIIACNTSTSLAYEKLKEEFTIPLIGVIEPGVDKALDSSANKRIGVIGTQATISSGAYQRLLGQKSPDAIIEAIACPPFVPLVEKGEIDGINTYNIVRSNLQPLLKKGIDSLILGCTHYPFLIPVITKVLGPSVDLINPARETVYRSKEKMRVLDLLREGENPVYQYYASGNPEEFRKTAGFFLKREIDIVKKAVLSLK